MSMGWFSV